MSEGSRAHHIECVQVHPRYCACAVGSIEDLTSIELRLDGWRARTPSVIIIPSLKLVVDPARQVAVRLEIEGRFTCCHSLSEDGEIPDTGENCILRLIVEEVEVRVTIRDVFFDLQTDKSGGQGVDRRCLVLTMDCHTVPALWGGRVNIAAIDAELTLRLRIIRQLVAKLAHNDAESFALLRQS